MLLRKCFIGIILKWSNVINADRSDGEANRIWQQEHLLKMSLKSLGCTLPSIL